MTTKAMGTTGKTAEKIYKRHDCSRGGQGAIARALLTAVRELADANDGSPLGTFEKPIQGGTSLESKGPLGKAVKYSTGSTRNEKRKAR